MAQRYYIDYTQQTTLPVGSNGITYYCFRNTLAWAVNDGVLHSYAVLEPRLLIGQGLLNEKAATNYCLYSRKLNNISSWAVTDCSVVDYTGLDNAIDSGSMIVPTASMGGAEQDINISDGTYVWSAYVKGVVNTLCKLVIDSTELEFTLTGAWQLIYLSEYVTGTATCKILSDENLQVDCVQFELGTVPSSPILTTSTDVTRDADDLCILWPASGVTPFTPTKGTFVVNIAAAQLASTPEFVFGIKDLIGTITTENLTAFISRTGGKTQLSAGINATDDYTFPEPQNQYPLNHRIGISYSEVDGLQIISLNGSAPNEAAGSVVIDFTNITHLTFGYGETEPTINGLITELSFYDTFADQDTLNLLTTPKVGFEDFVELAPELVMETAPTIAGGTDVGDVLTCTPGVYTGALPITKTYQWQRGGVDIAGATATTYTIVTADLGKAITCEETTDNVISSLSEVSNVINIPAGLLDLYPGAAAAFALRKLRVGYTGNCIRVRRSGDNAEQDIGFVGDVVDTSTLVSFCVAGGGTQHGDVVTWYDQSGNGRNLTNSTLSQQPRIVSSGAVINENSKPAISADGGDSLLYTFGSAQAQPLTLFTVGRSTSSGGAGGYFGSTSSPRIVLLLTGSVSAIALNAATSLSSGVTTTQRRLIYALANGASSQIALNGGSSSNGNAGTNGTSAFRVFNDVGGGPITGFMQELIIYLSNQSSNKSAIENEINTYYSVY